MRYLRILFAAVLGTFFAIPVSFALPPITATDLVCIRCVQFGDLAYNAVKSVNILNNSILNDDISATAAISPSKILGIAWTANNDGPGSGLNADFLDGFDSLQFLRSDVSGTLNGNLNVNGLIGALGGGLTSGNSETTFALENTGTGGQPWLIRSTNNTSGHGGGKLVFDIGGVAKAVVTPDAKFGVGTASPANNLDVVSGGNTKILVHANDGINDRNPELELRAGNTDAGAHSILKFSKTAGVAFEKFRIQNGSSADVLTLDGNGNVGVGTTAPNKKLTVVGPGSNTAAAEMNAPGNNAWGNLLVLRTLGIGNNGASILFRNRDVKNWQVGGEDGGDGFQIREDGGDGEYGSGFGEVRLHVNEGGNIGIGTTNPGHRLEVNGPGGSTMALSTIDGYGPSLTFGGGTSFKVLASNVSDSVGSNKFVLSNVGSAANLLTVDHTGNVGIGTTTPGYKLDVNGEATARHFWLTDTTSEVNLGLYNTGSGGQNWLLRSTNSASGHGAGKLVFDIGGVAKATLTALGNMGIGTTNPNYKLDVVGQVNGSELCIAGDCRTVWPSGSSSGGNVSGGGDANRLAKWTGGTTLGNSPVYIDSGNVGIDVAVPGKKLDVNGDLRVNNGIYGPESNPLTFFTDPASGPAVERMRIGAAGNVGIGTTGPDAPLNVSSNVVSDQGVLHVNATNATGSTRGIYSEAGSNGSNSTAVFGIQTNSNPVSAGGTFGVLGRILRSAGIAPANSSAAVFGDAIGDGDGPDANNTPDPFNALANGVQGETWSTNNGAAGGRFYNAQTTGNADGVYGQTNSTGSGAYGVFSAGPTGATGYKSAVVYTESQGPSELYAMESPEIWFEDIGMGRLENGRAVVALDPLFLETVTIDDNHPPYVFVQMYDDVTAFVKLGKPGFEVIEKDGGTSNAMFSYRIVAKRRYYEDYRLRPVPNTIDKFMRPDLSPDELKALNQKFGFHFEDFNDRDPNFYKR